MAERAGKCTKKEPEKGSFFIAEESRSRAILQPDGKEQGLLQKNAAKKQRSL